MQMKKRSQSSIRSKTIQSEDDQSQSNYWMGNIQAKKILTKAGQKITSSMIEQSNKQNYESNNFAFQSVQQISDRSQTVHHTPTTQKSGNMQKNNLISYNQMYEASNPNVQSNKQLPNMIINSNKLGHFNYVEQYYEVQIQNLNSKIVEMSTEIKRYRELYSSKQSQVQDLNEGLSSRISRENNQKNMLIKQINSNNIQIKRLKQEIQLHKSQKDTLKIMLKQKQTMIEQLNNSIVQIQIKKKKVEGYEFQLRESQNALKEIQIQMNKLRGQTQKKDAVIANSNKKISTLQTKLVQYQQQIKQLEKCMIGFKQNSSQSSHKIQQVEVECAQWKNKYCEVKQRLGQIPQLEIKLKNAQLTVQQLQARNKQFIADNQRLKIELGNFQSIKSRCNEQEKQITNLKKLLRQKCQELQIIQGNSVVTQNLQHQLEHFKNKLSLAQRDNLNYEQQIRMFRSRLQQKQHKIRSMQQQIQQNSKETIRIKQLKSNIDTLFSQNQKLHSCLLQKVAQIEDLQRKVNTLESKNVGISNELTKTKAMYQSMAQELSESESKLQNMKNRWQTQVGAKMGLQQKCTRLNKEVVILKTQVVTLEENSKMLQQKSEQLTSQFEQKKLELYMQLDQLNKSKMQSQIQIQNSNKKIDQLKFSIRQLKNEIQIQVTNQNNHILKINQLESQLVQLTEELCMSRQKTQKMKKYWIQVQQVSGNALNFLR